MTPLCELFDDEKLHNKIQRKLPFLFALAEQQASRGRRIGMEVGVPREQILVALPIYNFGKDSVTLDIPAVEHEIDVRVKGFPLSIKTATAQSKGTPAVKIIWTSEAPIREVLKSLRKAVKELIEHPLTKTLSINWQRPPELETKEASLAPYERWLHYWQSD